jgi:hypothetical protein
MQRLAVFLLTMTLFSCGAVNTPVVYTNDNPDASLQLMLSDRYECVTEATSFGSDFSGRADSISTSVQGGSGAICISNIWDACISARGWIRDDSALGSPNAFVVPAGAVIQCND